MKKLISFMQLLAVMLRAFFAPRPRLRFPTLADPLPRGDVYGTQAAKTRSTPVQKIDVRDLGARVRYLNEVYTQVGAGTIGDVIHLPGLPAGAKVIAHLSRIDWSAGDANATLAFGKTGAAAGLLAATAIQNAGGSLLTSPANGAADVTLADGEELIATNATAAIKAGQVIRFRIAYVENS